MKFEIYALLSLCASSLKLHNPSELEGVFNKTLEAEVIQYDEDCGDQNNYKCWKKGGHSLDKKAAVAGGGACTLMWTFTNNAFCQMDAEGCIFTIPDITASYPNQYKMGGSCTINVGQNPAPISVSGTFSTESSHDHLDVTDQGSVTPYSGSQGPDTITPTAGTSIVWTSDGSVTSTGWKICDSTCQTGTNPVHAPNVLSVDQQAFGGWGGTCTCPDGQVYTVGDHHNHCGTLACNGGIEGECHQSNNGANKMVTCGACTHNCAAGGALNR